MSGKRSPPRLRRRISPWPAAIALMLGASHAATYAQPATTTTKAATGIAKPSKTKLAAAPAKATVKTAADDSMPPPPPPPPPAFPAPAKHGPKPAGIAAVVNGINITDAEVSAQAYKQYGVQIVNGLIINKLVEQDAKKQGIVVTPAEVDAEIASIRKQVAGQPGAPTLEAILAQQHTSVADLKKNLKLKLAAQKIVGKNYKAPAMLHVSHILVGTTNLGGDPKATVHTDAEAKAIIAKAQADLKAGKSFDEVAKTYSEDPSNKDKGGDLGIINANTQFDPNFLQAALKLKAGEVTAEPVKSQFGYHLIKAVSTSDNPPASEKAEYDAAAKQMKEQQVGQGLQAYIQQLQAKAKIVNYLAP